MIVSGISEKDIDLLLLEEFIASDEFQKFFLNKVDKNIDYKFVNAVRSATDSTGESDLEVTFELGGKKLLLMIENKIGASFQEKQADRYIQRGQNKQKQGLIDEFITILTAPNAYFTNDNKGFHARINYEEILDWFENSNLEDGRKSYKKMIIKSAIEKGTYGYQVEADEPVTKFWKDYWLLSQDIAPELNMKNPGGKPSGSTFIAFRETGLHKNLRIVHKLTHGNMDLELSGMGDQINELNKQFKGKLDHDMEIVKASKSAAIRIKVPEINLPDGVQPQKDEIITAMLAGKRLLKCGMENFKQLI